MHYAPAADEAARIGRAFGLADPRAVAMQADRATSVGEV